MPEHDWLQANRHITSIVAESERTFRVDLDRPYALLDDLLAINPCAVVGPTSKDWEGEFMRPIGTGPFRFVGAFDEGRRWRIARVGDAGPALDVTFYPRGRDATPIDDLLAGRLDAFVGGWDEDLPAARLDALQGDARYVVQTAPGSSVVYLSFRLTSGPTVELATRQRIRAALDRAELIGAIEGGRADACSTWAAPAVAFWPRGRAAVQPPAAAPTSEPMIRLSIAAGRGENRAGRAVAAVAAQLRAHGFEVEVLAPPPVRAESPRAVVDASGAVTPLTTESGEVRAAVGRQVRAIAERADLRVEITHGMPYCPHQSLVARFGAPGAGLPTRPGNTPELQALVDQAAAEPDEGMRLPIYAQIQDLMDRAVLIVPLYVPWRVALRRSDLDGIRLGPDVYHVDLEHLQRSAPK